MSFMPTTRLFLRMFGLYPNKKITKTGVPDTLYIIMLSLPLWFVNLTSYAYLDANAQTADIAVITDSMYTNFIFTMMCGNYIILTIRKFQVRSVIDFMDDVVMERKLFIISAILHRRKRIYFQQQLFIFSLFDLNHAGRRIGNTLMYDDANDRSEYFIKMYTLWCFIGNMGVNCFPFLLPLFHYLTGQYSFASWYTPYKS